MSTLKRCNEDLRKYLMRHRLPAVFESLLTALAVNQPNDGIAFIVEKVLLLKQSPTLLKELQWDTFIDESRRPVCRLANMDFLWSDGVLDIDIAALEKAYSFYNYNLIRTCFRALKIYQQHRIQRVLMVKARVMFARKHHWLTIYKKHFDIWLEWCNEKKRKQAKLLATLTSIYHSALSKTIFRAWCNLSLESKRTREYFESIEKGEMAGHTLNGDKLDPISLLPKILAVNIFRFVDLPDLVNCTKVCRSWKEITQVSGLWSRIDLANAEKGLISSKAITSLIQKCRPFLSHLNVRGCNFLLGRTLTSIGDCRNLQDLNISNCQGVTDDVIRALSIGCPSLLYLNMSRNDVTDTSMRYISRNCNSLQYINISHCLKITNRGLHYLSSGKGSQKLMYLDMSGCDQITYEGYKTLSKGCLRLNTINLNEIPSLTDNCVEALMSGSKNLRTLSILHSTLLTDEALKCIGASKKLQVLKIEGNNRLSDVSIKLLIRNNPELRYLYFVDVQRLTDMSLKALSQARNLCTLNLADCVRISDTGVRYLIEGSSGLKLRELNLTNCIRVSDVSLLRISQKCTSLAYVNFSYCEHITDAGVELLASISKLISIDLSGCNITDAGVIALGNNPNLKDIIISECCNITDTGLQKLVPKVRDLETLDVSHAHLLTDASLKNIAFSCRHIRVLNVSGCYALTDQGIQYLSGVCQFIELLDISGCRRLTDRSLRYLRKGCRNIKTLTMLYCSSISRSAVTKWQNKMKSQVNHSQEETMVYLGNRAK